MGNLKLRVMREKIDQRKKGKERGEKREIRGERRSRVGRKETGAPFHPHHHNFNQDIRVASIL